MSRQSFEGNNRRFLHVPPQEVYASIIIFLEKDMNATVKTEEDQMRMTAKLRGVTKVPGLTIHIRVIPEGEASAVTISFSYEEFVAAAIALLLGFIFLNVALFSFFPLLGTLLLLILMYNLGSSSNAFLNAANDFLLLLEKDHDQKSLAESRRRWQADLRNPKDLYEKLLIKHTKTWGDAHALEYKISEYVSMGLTREEAIRKVADEEGE